MCRSGETAIDRYSLHLSALAAGELVSEGGAGLLQSLAAATAEADATLRAGGASLMALVLSRVEPSLYAELSAAYAEDALALRALEDLKQSYPSPWELHKGLLYYKGGEGVQPFSLRMYVPESLRQRVVREHHDTPYAGHLGKDKMLELVKRRFYWPGMGEYVARYVQTCPTCQATKPHGTVMT
jgi:hypothetical protein